MTIVTRLRLDAALYEPAPPREQARKARRARKASASRAWRSGWAIRARFGRGRPYTGMASTREVELASGTAVWYHSGMPVVPIRWVLIRDPLGKFEPQALLSTDLERTAAQIVEWFVLRWQVEVTFEEARAHLGVETQRQWSDLAIARTTPALLGLFSLVTVFAHQLLQGKELTVRQAAWYQKQLPTFSDTLALVRQQLWPVSISWMSGAKDDVVIIPKALFVRLTDTLAYAA